MEDIKQMLQDINSSLEKRDYDSVSQLCLHCSLYFFQQAKKETVNNRERSINFGKRFLELYDTSKTKIHTNEIQNIENIVKEVQDVVIQDVLPQNYNVVDQHEKPDSKIVSMRPFRLSEYIGQTKIVNQLNILIAASKQRHDALDHILLYGNAGLGKTSLSQIISHEMNAHFIEINATTLTDVQSFATILKNISFGDILFIDEIHALSSSISDMLLTVLEDYHISYIEGKSSQAKVVDANINKFTFIGATTNPGLLSKPLLDRMIHKFKMDSYTFSELSLLIKNSFQKWGITIGDEGAYEIAKRSRYVPRIANNFVLIFRDIAQIKSIKHLTKDDVLSYYDSQDIDDEGITNDDRHLLDILIHRFNGGPVSLASLASVLGDNQNIVESQIEPYLVQKGMLTITKSGRVCTEAGMKYMTEYNNKDENNHEFK